MTRHQTAAPRKDPKTGGWYFIVDIGTGADGKRRQTRRRGFATKKAAQEELDLLRRSVTTQTYLTPRRQSFAQFVENDWLPVVTGSLEESTVASYTRNLRLHVLPRIGGLQLSTVDAGHLNRMFAELRADGGRRDSKPGGLSPRTIRYIATIVGEVFGTAVEWDRIVRNPATSARPPRARDAKAPPMKTWTAGQLEEFLRLAEGNRYQPAWLFLATSGCRRGEALGLTWSDVDLDARTAAIRQTVTAVEHRVRMGGQTKTGKARAIRLDGRTVTTLRTWKARQASERLLVGAGWQDHDLVFTLPDGRPYHPERFSREFDRMIERHHLDRIRLHDLRHTWATLALQAGVSLKIVSERLGHTTTAITADVYTHVTPGMQTDAADKVAALIFGEV